MENSFIKKISSKLFLYLLLLYAIVCLVVTIQNFYTAKNAYNSEITYTHYNNYIIFKQSFLHLIQHKNLYQLYEYEHWDYYKYSPTFAFLIAPFYVLPDFLGLLCWNLLNAFVFCFAIYKLNANDAKKTLFMVAFTLIELITSIQNSQSNVLIAGLLIQAFNLAEKNKIGLSALLITCSVFIKLFGIVAFAMLLFYPNRIKTILYSFIWIILFVFLPLLIIPFSELIWQYTNWLELLKNDHSASVGISFAGIMFTWFGLELKTAVFIFGSLLFFLPLLKWRSYANLNFKQLFLSAMLIWIVIFNHKAESPTFIIAIAGIAIWFFNQAKSRVTILLVTLAFILTSLSPTDIFPRFLRETYVIPYALKALPCVLIWLKISYDMLRYKSST